MADADHYWSADLSFAPNGDMAMIDGTTLGTQRVIRRLMTCPGEYIWHPTYGAGIPLRVGRVQNNAVILAVIRSQIFLEDCVARTPPPSIKVASILNGVMVTIRYTDAFSKQIINTTFPIYARPFTQSQQSQLALEVPS